MIKIDLLKKIFFAILIYPAFLFISCHREEKPDAVSEEVEKAKLKETLVRANKIFTGYQMDDIDEYVHRHQLEMDTTLSGLRIKINKTGKGPLPEKNNSVTINYSLTLLDGTACYDSDSTGAWKFSMSYDDVPKGLREAVYMMRAGDKALAIVPSYLGYGLTGDANKIPPNAALIYEIELLKIE